MDNGKYDACAAIIIEASNMFTFDILGSVKVLHNQGCRFKMFRRDEALLDKINKGMALLRHDPEWENIKISTFMKKGSSRQP